MSSFTHLVHAISCAIEQKKILIIEAMDMGLHPTRLLALIESFSHNNKAHAQIIATMHSSTIMTYVRPDQIYLIDKIRVNDEIKTKLISIAEFNLTGCKNIEQMYLAGRFGGVPSFGETINVEKSSRFIAQVFSHEYLHMIQRSKQLSNTDILSTSRHSEIKNSKISANYRASANEVHAFATDSARDLYEYCGSVEEALKHLTTTSDINKAADISIAFRGYYKLKNEPDGNVLFNQFLKEIVQQLNAIITNERLEKEFNSP